MYLGLLKAHALEGSTCLFFNSMRFYESESSFICLVLKNPKSDLGNNYKKPH
jgi:hypothetical protein